MFVGLEICSGASCFGCEGSPGGVLDGGVAGGVVGVVFNGSIWIKPPPEPVYLQVLQAIDHNTGH